MIGSFKKWVAQAKGGKIDWDELEATLIQSDLGMELTERTLQRLQSQPLSAENIQTAVKDELLLLWPQSPRCLDTALADASAEEAKVVLVIGVNGSGKTTSIAKLSHRYQRQGQNVFMVAADTFRAAAIEQLATWAGRIGCGIHPGTENGDPAAAVFQGIAAAQAAGAGITFIDTAGRLHNNVNLVRELEKVKRVIGKQHAGAPHEVLLVVDGTNGSNAIRQAEDFHQALGLTGLIVTKLDSSSKGGAVAAIKSQLHVDTLFTGSGEGLDDLHPFDPEQYISDFFVGD
ncbi:MAG: signal recognition particle-docking protein FtsY [Verrucomicrobiota bacterium]